MIIGTGNRLLGLRLMGPTLWSVGVARSSWFFRRLTRFRLMISSPEFQPESDSAPRGVVVGSRPTGPVSGLVLSLRLTGGRRDW